MQSNRKCCVLAHLVYMNISFSQKFRHNIPFKFILISLNDFASKVSSLSSADLAYKLNGPLLSTAMGVGNLRVYQRSMKGLSYFLCSAL